MAVYTHTQLEGLWDAAGGDQSLADTMAAIAQAESGGDTTQVDNTSDPNLPGYHAPAPGNLPEYSVGLWQINTVAHPQYSAAQMLDPAQNAVAAAVIERGPNGLSNWSTYTSGAYKAYLSGSSTLPPGFFATPGPKGVRPRIKATTAERASFETPISGAPADVFQSYRGVRDALIVHCPAGLNHAVTLASKIKTIVRVT